jgi:hypothetical protein
MDKFNFYRFSPSPVKRILNKNTTVALCLLVLSAHGRLYGGGNRTETMSYSLEWKGIKVGEAVMKSSKVEDLKSKSFEIKSTGLAGFFKSISYKIDMEQLANTITVKKNIKDGKYSQNDTLIISNNQAHWKNEGTGEVSEYEVPQKVYDYVSMLDAIRNKMKLNVGESMEILLALDGGLHAVILTAASKSIEEWEGEQIPVILYELSTTSSILFSRNMPKTFSVCEDENVILHMKIQTKRGLVYAKLNSWAVNGESVELKKKR